MSTELSIIVPIHNSEKYLSECLKSICQQIHKNVEIILINDHSTDGSMKICQKYSNKFNFIKINNQKKNKGVSYCRNIGINLASGKYICFVDSDDKLLKGSINIILNQLKTYPESDLFVLRSEDISKKNFDENQILNLKKNKISKSIINNIENFIKFRATCWNFIVRKEFLHSQNINFNNNIRIFEDQVFVSKILCLEKNFKIIQKSIYARRIFEPDSLGKKTGHIVVISCINIIYEISKFIYQRKKNLNQQKINFLYSRLKFVKEQLLLNIIACELFEIKKASRHYYKYISIISKLSKFGFRQLDFLSISIKNINKYLIKHKYKKIKILKNIVEKFRSYNLILFCTGSYSKIILKSFTELGVEIDIIIDNNIHYSEKKFENATIKNPPYLKKNLKKLLNHKILVCNKNILEFNKIKLQLIKIGIKNKNLLHVRI